MFLFTKHKGLLPSSMKDRIHSRLFLLIRLNIHHLKSGTSHLIWQFQTRQRLYFNGGRTLNVERQSGGGIQRRRRFLRGPLLRAIGPASCRSHRCFITVCPWPRDPPAFICTSVRTTPSLRGGRASCGPDTHITPLTSRVHGRATGLRYELRRDESEVTIKYLNYVYFGCFASVGFRSCQLDSVLQMLISIIAQ